MNDLNDLINAVVNLILLKVEQVFNRVVVGIRDIHCRLSLHLLHFALHQVHLLLCRQGNVGGVHLLSRAPLRIQLEDRHVDDQLLLHLRLVVLSLAEQVLTQEVHRFDAGQKTLQCLIAMEDALCRFLNELNPKVVAKADVTILVPEDDGLVQVIHHFLKTDLSHGQLGVRLSVLELVCIDQVQNGGLSDPERDDEV